MYVSSRMAGSSMTLGASRHTVNWREPLSVGQTWTRYWRMHGANEASTFSPRGTDGALGIGRIFLYFVC